jgi:hypothetical protein
MADKIPTAQSNLVFVEQASCLLLTVEQASCLLLTVEQASCLLLTEVQHLSFNRYDFNINNFRTNSIFLLRICATVEFIG